MRKLGSTAHEELLELERCPECRARLVDSGGEVACSSCGLVLGASQAIREPLASTGRPGVLGSYVGRAPGGMGRSRVGFVFGTARVRANAMGRDLSFLQCSRLIERVACRFFLPKGIVQNAVLTAERLLPNMKAHGVTAPALSAYSLLHACRSAGIFHVGFDELLKAFSEAGHRISARQLLRIGSESSLPLPAVRPEALAQGAVARLRSDIAVQSRIKEANLDEAEYFTNLLEVARAIATDASTMGGFSPRTVVAASVYLASRRLGPKVIRQKEVAESLGIAEYTIREFCRRFVRSREAR